MIERPIKVGDIVRLSFGFADRSGQGDYEIVRVMPVRESGERHYRVRGTDGRERAIGHNQIVVSKAKAKSPVSGPRG
jgi:hypothetical protein